MEYKRQEVVVPLLRGFQKIRNPNNICGHWRPESYKRQEVVEPLHKGGEPPANNKVPAA